MAVNLTSTRDVIESGMAEGLHLGAQLFVASRGDVVADLAIGSSRDDGTPMRVDTLNLWMSSVKPLAAVATMQLVERGRLTLDDRVEQHIPEFGVNGKAPITIRHLLVHTGGFRAWPPGLAFEAPWDEAIAAICAMRLEPSWIPGEKAGYHPRTSWMILGEVVRRLDHAHRTYDRYVREEILLPLKMNDSWAGGMPEETHRTYGDRIGAMIEQGAAHVPDAERCALVRPGSTGRGPMRELARFYMMLMNNGELDGACVVSRESVEQITRPQRVGMFDNTFKAQIDWGLGTLLNSHADHSKSLPYGYGRHASRETFGHSGAESSCAFCDPTNGLIVAWVCNGMPGDAKHQARQIAINEAIYEDLGIV